MNTPPFIQMPPVANDEDIKDFDRATCANGTTDYIRNSHPAEILPRPCDFIRVTEILPGIRARTQADRPR
jgi:hypothetical protein